LSTAAVTTIGPWKETEDAPVVEEEELAPSLPETKYSLKGVLRICVLKRKGPAGRLLRGGECGKDSVDA